MEVVGWWVGGLVELEVVGWWSWRVGELEEVVGGGGGCVRGGRERRAWKEGLRGLR